MKSSHLILTAMLAVACRLPAEAEGLNGVWATNVQQCNKIFLKQNGSVDFAKASEIYGNGFIIESNKIRVKTAICNIKSRKEDGSVTHMVMTCATEIMMLDTQFSMRLVTGDTLERIYPGIPELNSKYERCEM